MNLIHGKPKDDDPDRERNDDEPLNVPRRVRVSVNLGGGSVPRTAEVELPASTEDGGSNTEPTITVDQLISGFAESMRKSDDYSDQLFADEVLSMYNRPSTIVERMTSDNLVPVARTSNVESLDSEFSFSLGADHVGGGGVSSPLPSILRVLGSGNVETLAWDGQILYYPKATSFVPLSTIPELISLSPPSLKVWSAWFLLLARKHIESVVKGESPTEIPEELAPYDITYMPDNPLCRPSLYSSGKVYKLEPSADGSYQLGARKYKKGGLLGDLAKLMQNYEKAVHSLEERREKHEGKIINLFQKALQKTTQKRVESNLPLRSTSGERIFYESMSGWRLLYNPKTGGCTIELQHKSPFIMEDENGIFYLFPRFAAGFRFSSPRSGIGYTGLTPVITYPNPFDHPFTKDNNVCTNGYAEAYRHNNLVVGIIHVLPDVIRILKSGYSDWKANAPRARLGRLRFRPYKRLRDTGQKTFSSIKEAEAAAPVYRFYIEDRAGIKTPIPESEIMEAGELYMDDELRIPSFLLRRRER